MSKDQNLFPGDAYKTLGVHRSGTAAELKAAWRALMVLHHPDKASGNPVDADRRTRKTAEINGAYESLKTSDRRQAYNTARPNDGKTADEMARERARSREPQPRPRTHTDRDSARDTGRRGGGIPWTDERQRAAEAAWRRQRENSPEYQARRQRSPVARFLRNIKRVVTTTGRAMRLTWRLAWIGVLSWMVFTTVTEGPLGIAMHGIRLILTVIEGITGKSYT